MLRRSGLVGGILALLLASLAHGKPRAPNAPRLGDFLRPVALDKFKGDSVYQQWIFGQVRSRPEVRATFDALARDLERRSPRTVHALISSARRFAGKQVRRSEFASIAKPEREHLQNLIAWVALSAHVFEFEGSRLTRFPLFMADGRKQEIGFDKSWHLVNHAMLSYVRLFDRTYGAGTIAKHFDEDVERVDPGFKWSRPVARAYDASRGRSGPLLRFSQPGPAETRTPFFQLRARLDEEDRAVYRQVVRTGDQYEAYTTRFPIFPSNIGVPRETDNPIETRNSHFEHNTGLSDAGVGRDLTANRMGAWLGIATFRKPQKLPRIPFDYGRNYESAPFSNPPPLDVRDYVQRELSHVGQLGWAGVRAPQSDAMERVDAKRLRIRLGAEFSHTVDALEAFDRGVLAKYYANFSIRHLRTLAISSAHTSDHLQNFEDHRRWAATAPVEDIKREIAKRLDAVFVRAR